jgi:hypothetical protein
LSIRMKQLGLRVELIPEAYVFHQRRTSLKEFFKQVANFGKGRVLVGRAHPSAVKLVHWFPTFFLLGLFLLVPVSVINFRLGEIGVLLYLIYLLAILADSYKTSKSIEVALLSVPSAFVQLTGYGWGFLREIFNFIT